ncbi:MAG: hypothetical protein ACP6IP_06025 [Candidatus Njordarchaeia archaeon]
MSTIGKFISWLAGRSPPPNPDELRKDLRLLERRLERFERNLEKKRKKSLKSIEKSLKNNEMDIAKEHAKQAVMLERDLKSIIKLRGKVTNLLNLVERGLIVDKIRESIQDMVPIVQIISKTLVDKNLQAEFSELMKSLEELEIGEEMLSENVADLLDEGSIDEDAEKLLRSKMVEVGVEMPVTKERTKERKVSKEEIEKLLREAAREEEMD